MAYLYAAFIITWAVIIFYILTMVRGFKKVNDELRELER